MIKYRRIKGTQDILPDEAVHWQYIEKEIRACMTLFNYRELRTPVFENTELFARGIGQATDIVSKEMYSFLDRGKKSLTLKPEMTAPIMRAYLENNLSAKFPLNKIYYIAPLFRQENPQAGRLRQFNQFGAEAIGSAAPELDVELILLALKIYDELGVKNLELVLNTVGDPESRDTYREILVSYLTPLLGDYCADCNKRYETNPLRVLDCKVPSCIELNRNAPRLTDHLNEASRNHFETVKGQLGSNKIEFKLEPNLVRGLDYYTHTVFEITSSRLGSQDAICGGGRYDLLAEQFGGKATPAVGFASGIERLIMVMKAQDIIDESSQSIDIFISPLGNRAVNEAVKWTHTLRSAGYSVDMDYLGRSLKAQMREANRVSAAIVLIIGDDEITKSVFSLKHMEKGTQQTVPFSQIQEVLQDLLKE